MFGDDDSTSVSANDPRTTVVRLSYDSSTERLSSLDSRLYRYRLDTRFPVKRVARNI
ncbi:hypothetical protein HSB1_10340 [Halogranum salarium B-1]|uniref:Uncharacterized protein n=1 Tax=Halogranum salarium B-1 TaxID=1210908 RepID=J3JGV6_9EURY|nr:hypothetical protein HSB1_10340 [Halogranum salarium B-1]